MVNIPLFNQISSEFTQTIKLGKEYYKIRIRWNTRSESWFLHLFDHTGNPLVTGKRLVPNYPLTEIYSGRFPGELLVLDTRSDLSDARITYDNLGKRFLLVYLDEEEADGL